MKYFGKVIAVLLLIAAVIAFAASYNYRQDKIADSIELTTADMTAHSSTERDERFLAAESEGGEYQLYLDGSTVILKHGDVEKTFDNWASLVRQEVPELYCRDYDGDGEDELLIKLINGYVSDNGAQRQVYNLYLLKPTETDGVQDFKMITATKDTWKAPFESAIKTEMTQLKSCDKIIQFVMGNAGTEFIYDEKTGVSQNEYVGYACALRDANGGYRELKSWNKGSGFYSVDENGDIFLDIQLLAYYKDVDDPQYIGNIHTQIVLKKNRFDLAANSITFVANDDYKVTSPKDAAAEDWKSTIYNSAEPTVRDGDDMIIDWIETDFDLTYAFTEKTVSFADINSQIKCVDKVVIKPDSIAMTAKEGYTFEDRIIRKFEFSVIISPDTEDGYNIEYYGEIKTVKDRSVLVIHFDRAYSREELNGMQIKYGV